MTLLRNTLLLTVSFGEVKVGCRQLPERLQHRQDVKMAAENGSVENLFDNFCSMVVEEYLIRKNLTATLDTLRSERQRPSEVFHVQTMFDEIKPIISFYFYLISGASCCVVV